MPSVLIGVGTREPGKRIALETAAGTPIDNEQIQEVSPQELSSFSQMASEWGLGNTFRAPPCARYNCHGRTFASSRTGIFEGKWISLIFREDGYSEVQKSEALAGDVILYFDAAGEPDHSGILLSAPKDSLLGVPQVLSKWGKGPEVVHAANHCPYDFSRVRYFRLMP